MLDQGLVLKTRLGWADTARSQVSSKPGGKRLPGSLLQVIEDHAPIESTLGIQGEAPSAKLATMTAVAHHIRFSNSIYPTRLHSVSMSQKSTKPTLSFTNFWPGFEPEHFFQPAVSPFFDLTDKEADVVVFSCFEGRKIAVPRIAPGEYLRLFYTAENIEPDFTGCDYAISFSHDRDTERHVRIPNYVSRLFQQGIDLTRFVLPRTDAEVDELIAAKRAFCAYVQKKPVAIRERLVRKLSLYQPVACLGPHLNNAGGPLPMDEKHTRLRDYKFTVAFENSSAPGYVTEKAVDAYVAGSIPLYWGDPLVDRFLNPDSMLIMQGGESSLDQFVERIAMINRHEEQYRAILKQPLFKPEALAAHLDGSSLREFFGLIARNVHRWKRCGGA